MLMISTSGAASPHRGLESNLRGLPQSPAQNAVMR
jgi:hypothetical protein